MKVCFQSLLVGVLLLVMGGLVFGFGVYRLLSGNTGIGWSSVQGEVVPARTVESTGSDGTERIPVVRYQYKVGNETYVGNRVSISPDPEIFTPRGAKKILKEYPTGKKVEVFYDTRDPGKSVLVREKTFGSWLQIGIGFLLLLGGIVCLKVERSSHCLKRMS